MLYYRHKERATAHSIPMGYKGLTSEWIAMPPEHRSKYQGGFCYVIRLLTKRKYECKQCQKEYAECQQLHKRNMNLMFLMFSLFHSITPILFRMRSTHPVTRLLFWDYNISFDAPQHYLSFFIIRHLWGQTK